MAKLSPAQQPQALVDALEYPDDSPVKEAFAHAILALPRISGITVSPERHGFMSSLGVFGDDSWCFSINPTKQWLKNWIRKPEIRRNPTVEDDLVRTGIEFVQNGSGEYTLKIKGLKEMVDFVELVVE